MGARHRGAALEDCQARRGGRSSAGVRRLCSGLLVALLGSRVGVAAPAERPAVEFRWDAPAGCPGEAEVVAELERLLGGPLAARGGPRLTAIARVRQEPGGGYDLRLWTVRDEGTLQRSIVHAQCDALARAGALIAAMAIDPNVLGRMAEGTDAAAVAREARTVEGAEPPPEPPPPPPEPVQEPVRSEPAEAEPTMQPGPATRRARAVRGGLRVSAGLSVGDLPGAGALVRVTPALLWERARLELEASYGPVRQARFTDRPDQGADLQLASGAVRGCPVLRKGRVEFPLCAGLEVGAVYGRGVGFARTSEGRLLFAALHLAPAVLFAPHPRVAVGAIVEGAIHVARPRFVVEGTGEVFRSAPASVRALATVELRFR